MMLKGKNAIVTGSTSGIGLAIAHALAAEGCNVLLNGFGDKAAISALVNELQQKYRVNVDYSPADMTKPKDIVDMVAMGERMFGSVDILVNNAGIQFTAPVDQFPAEKWDAIIAINLSASFHGIRAALPGMKKRNYGRIINIASVHGLVASENKCAYVAAKHGLIGLTKVVALENGDYDISCSAICPGWVHTPLVEKQVQDKAKAENITPEEATKEMLGEKQAMKRFTHPEQIGGLVVFLCGDAAATMTGAPVIIDGGWTAQ
ncbi:MAG: 3-hydroxybutyrate dehydrogenase [Pseudomonadota bacterium]|nr:3-hydroxybutyrate dehydrogenase [Pseudomonadota bacterium]MDE3036835.1 3-hydroxybutyrate dehydrogenase [Pseudomonadota bacterium]